MVGRVSISALSDRGLLLACILLLSFLTEVSISALSDRGLLLSIRRRLLCWCGLFQYPLFRIVDCFYPIGKQGKFAEKVSISALSDRGLLRASEIFLSSGTTCFNIRSFGSWIASRHVCVSPQYFSRVSISALSDRGLLRQTTDPPMVTNRVFQYPLFRIVDCFSVFRHLLGSPQVTFQYPLFRIVDCFVGMPEFKNEDAMFQYPLFRIVDCFRKNSGASILSRQSFNIRSFGSWIAS